MNRDFSLSLFISVFLVIGPTQGIAQTQPDPTRYESSILAFEDQDFLSPPPNNAILLVGSSSIGLWNQQAPADLSPFTVVPRGFGGSVMNDVIYYFDRIVAKYNPRAIVLYEGDNDLAWGLSPETILNQLDMLIDMIKLELPGTRLYILSVKPSLARANLWARAQEVNAGFALRAESDKNIFHIDVDTYLLDESGGFRPNLYTADFLHLNDAGYDIWADVIRAALTVQEAPLEGSAIGTNFYLTTSELISDCVNLTTEPKSEALTITLSFYLIESQLAISDFAYRNSQTVDCSDQLAVTLAEDESVESALYSTEKLYIRGESTKYSLNAEYSSVRKPVSENGGKFIFDQIDYSTAD